MSGQVDKYGDVVQRLEEVVKRLEGGELPLEESLRAFEDGIRLIRRGEQLLGEAEKRIEQLMTEGGQEKVVPLDLPTLGGEPRRTTVGPAATTDADEDDIPF